MTAFPRHPLLVACVLCAALSLLTACGESSSDDEGSDTASADMTSGDTSAPDTSTGDTTTPDDTTTADTSTADTAPDVAPECTSDDECTDAALPICDDTGTCVELPAGHLIGWGDGTAASVTFTQVYDDTSERQATDLDFNTERPNELWVVYRHPESSQPCGELSATQEGCLALEGSVVIITDPGSPESTNEWKKDENAWHFMRRPPSIDFGADGFFATCGEARTGNYLDEPGDFIGPTLWDSDPSIFAITPPGGNGSHMDMLHLTPWCMGIAHEAENIYWTFNGQSGALDRYDFNDDHGPGNADHSDGEVWRYAEGEVSRVENVPSHMVYRTEDQHLYVADTGNQRIIKLDTTTGTPGPAIQPVYEPLQTNEQMLDATVAEVVPAGELLAPSGLAVDEGVLYVSDNTTSFIYAFDLDGNLLNSLHTGFPQGSLAGITVGPDGYLYFVDMPTGDVYRIEP